MKNKPAIPSGYKVATKETRQAKFNKSMTGVLLLEMNEVLSTGDLVEKTVQIEKTVNGAKVKEDIIVCKLNCSSSTGKDRLVPLAFFNPYPTERTELMSKSRFFKDVAEFPGTVDEFIDWLEDLERPLKVIGNPRMNYTEYGTDKVKSKVFYVLEYADLN